MLTSASLDDAVQFAVRIVVEPGAKATEGVMHPLAGDNPD
jgi:hypothetical protein